tara:strand:+ start:238 stop:534 length:297 start_codon:yes stop_codon:yes gene_type:complete
MGKKFYSVVFEEVIIKEVVVEAESEIDAEAKGWVKLEAKDEVLEHSTTTNLSDVPRELPEYIPEPMEPDEIWMDADALASAGWGTDEDYGFYGYEEEY